MPAAKKAKAKLPPKTKKDTIYIDIDDEVTAVVDKVISTKSTIAAVVLPKKATVFLSQVNTKLVKRAAEKANKKLVLITSDKAIISIASSSGVPTATTLTSKPKFPEEKSEKTMAEVTIDLEDDSVDTSADATEEEVSDKPSKKLKIPNFSSFRIKLGLSLALLIGLGAAWYVGFVVLPEATVLINADISTVAVDERVTLVVGAEAVDTETGVIPAERVQIEKTNEVTVSATGEKNIGKKATGVVNVENCIDSNEIEVIAAGARFSAGSLTFVTTEQVILEPAVTGGGECFSKDVGRDKNVNVEALEAGPAFNISEQVLVSSISGINALGGQMSGGTTQIVRVVSQDDIDQAKAQIEGLSRSEASAELQLELEQLGATPVVETLAEGTPRSVFSPDIDDEASEVKVTTTITYNLVGVRQDDVQAIINASIADSLADAQQNVRDNGLAGVAYTIVDASDNAEQIMQIRTVASVGPDIDLDSLRQQIAGMKRGEIKSTIEAIDGVRSVSVEYSPGWITTTPTDADKITIELNESNDQ